MCHPGIVQQEIKIDIAVKKELTANRNKRQDLPTPESPMSNSLKR